MEKKAGSAKSFEVASIRQSAPDAIRRDNIDLGPLDFFAPTGGLFSVNVPLEELIIFACKIADTSQYGSLGEQLPKWAKYPTKFDIEARAEGNPSKDELRLMVQALLAARLQLKIHTETKQLSIYALVFDKPGQSGPQLKPHPADVPCPKLPDSPSTSPEPTPVCGLLQVWTTNGVMHFRMLNVSMNVIAGYLPGAIARGRGGLDDRQIVDQTGAAGNFDFTLGSVPESPASMSG